MSDQPKDDFERDLHPNAGAGQNNQRDTTEAEKNAPTAYDIQEIQELLSNITSDNLRQIPILPTGTRLQQGATYVDLHDPSRPVFKARGDQTAGEYNWIVPKSEVDYQLWNEIIGVQEAERLDEAAEA